MTRRGFTFSLCGLSLFARRHSIALAADYLIRRQARDGGWHTTYGLLRSGQSLTPLVTLALLEAGAMPAEARDRALRFILRRLDATGALGMADPLTPDYPNYATALAVSAFARARPEGWRESIAPMIAYLRRQQFSERGGWEREHPAYGAWGMGGDERHPPHAGHVDLSMTRHVLEALAAAGEPVTGGIFARAQVFLRRCQMADGGFFFSSIVPDANKAGPDSSYGSTTADGILSLAACGVPLADPRMARAAAWLRPRAASADVPGFEHAVDRRWAKALRFYWMHASAAACRRLGWQPAERDPEQSADGSWRNAETLGKEDDPLIASALALGALCGQ